MPTKKRDEPDNGTNEDGKSTKKSKTSAKKQKVACDGNPDETGWCHLAEPYLIFRVIGAPKACAKIAAFDWDSTIVVERFGGDKAHAVAKNQPHPGWKLFNPAVPEKLKELQEEGYRIVVFSNQGAIKTALGGTKAQQVKEQVMMAAEELEIPFMFFAAPANDKFRKPATGMWDYFVENCNDGIKPDTEASFFCGDAAGRPGDFAASDKELAANVGIPFKVPEDVFGEPESKRKFHVNRPRQKAGSPPPPYSGPNPGLVDIFERLIEKVKDEENAHFKIAAFRKSRDIIAGFDKEIKSAKELKGIQGIGKKTLEKVQVFIDTGRCPDLDGDVGADGSVPKKEPKKENANEKSAAAAFL